MEHSSQWEPDSGRIIALSSHSEIDPDGIDIAVRSGMPAASLIKVITAAAALEVGGLEADSSIAYRGGDYTLNRRNYLADSKSDRRKMTLERALAKSCNPVFGRIATEYLSGSVLKQYAEAFAFQNQGSFAIPVAQSTFSEVGDTYQLARTGAGFGDVQISPVHAASIAAAIANNGKLMQPRIVDRAISPEGAVVYEGRNRVLKQSVSSETAQQLLEMMESTVKNGTARKQFRRSRVLKGIRVARQRTGTLSGKSPKGRYHWLIAAAPVENPEIAIAAVVIDPGSARINGVGVGRLALEEFFKGHTLRAAASSSSKNL